MRRCVFVVAAIASCTTNMLSQPAESPDHGHHQHHEIKLLDQFRPIGGAGNNIQNQSFNAVPGSAEIALTPLNFASGTKNGLVNGPNARTISNVIAGGKSADGDDGATTDPVASAWLYVFGQFVDHDLDLESTPTNTADISIIVPPDDPVFAKGTVIAMTRDARNPSTNTIINTTAGYLDLSQLYGSTSDVASGLRNPDGTLQSSDNGRALPVVDNAFVSGDPRVMENPELTATTILFMREHNLWVSRLAAQNPFWTGDQLYNMAKAITTAEYQNIIYSEYLPLLVGGAVGSYHGYDPSIHAQVTQEFSTAAFRVGHSEVSDEQEGLDNNGHEVFEEPLAQAFYNTAAIDESNGIDPLLRGVSADFSQATDVYVLPALRNLLFAPLVGGDVDQVDLIAIDIQRERDVGLGTLNETRRAIGFAPYTSFAQVTNDPTLRDYLQEIYGNIDNLDLFIGGLAENHVQGAEVGPTFQAIIAMQFQALRAGDRFFWLNQEFDPATAQMISQTKLADIIRRNTDTTSIQANVFYAPSTSPHVKSSAPSIVIDNHGRRGRPFIEDPTL